MRRHPFVTTILSIALLTVAAGCGGRGEPAASRGTPALEPAAQAGTFVAKGTSGRIFIASTQDKADAAAAIDRSQSGFITHHGRGPGGVNVYVEEGLTNPSEVVGHVNGSR